MSVEKEHITIRLTPQDHCMNCGGIVYSKYCSDCGQRHHEGRLSFKIMFEELVAKIFQLDSAILRTLWGVVRPGLVIREYIAGKRKKYMKPINFHLLMLAIYLYMFSHINPYPEADLMIEKRGFAFSFSRSLNWYAQQIKLIQIVAIPLYSFYTLKAFKQWEYNYFEHISLWLYLGAFGNVLNVSTIAIFFMIDWLFHLNSFTHAFNLSMSIAILYGLFCVVDIFQLYSLKGVLKGVWTFLYCSFLVLLLTLGVSLIFTYIDLYFINPVL